MAVTCGAAGSTRDLTLAVVRRLARERGLEAVPHVTATGFTRDDLIALLREARAGGADNVLALRGDPPRGESVWRAPEGGVSSSLEVIELAAEAGFCVLGAGYPEPHPDSRGWAHDLAHVRAKVDAGDARARDAAVLRQRRLRVAMSSGCAPAASTSRCSRA